jgi:DNA modification methylase
MSKIFYEDEIVKVYNNNFQDIIKELSFNLIITDPPYNKKYKYPDYKDNMSDEDYINMLSELNRYKSVVIHYPEAFGGDIAESLGKPDKLVPWCYNTNLNRQCRLIGWFDCSPDFSKERIPYKDMKDKRNIKLMENGSKGAKLYDWWSDIGLIKNTSKEKLKGFTNQIPIKLLERIINITTNEGDVILDPFFGSGSLYFACKNTGRKCIGIEQSKKHLELFKQRLLM